jgi:hypothetical protein
VGAPLDPLFGSFSGSFSGPFLEHSFNDFGTQNRPQHLPRISRKMIFVVGSRLEFFFSVSELPLDALLQSSGRLGAVLGSLKSEKMETVRCENHLFESRLCRFLEVYLALLGLLPDQSCGPDCTQNLLKNNTKIGPKNIPKWDPILSRAWTHFGVYSGVQNGGIRGPLFQSSSGWLQSPILAPSWPHLVPSWPLFDSSWPHLGPSWLHLGPILAPSWPLGLSWRPLGPVLAPSWHHAGPSWLHLAPSWPLLASSWPHFGPMWFFCGVLVDNRNPKGL